MRTLTSSTTRRRLAPLLVTFSACAVLSGAMTPAAFADDARSHEWYLDAMQADSMWKVSSGQGVTVAVVDSGVDPSAPELQGQLVPGEDLNDGKAGETEDRTGHGTEMAALIAGTGAGGGIQGLAPRAKILPLRYNVKAPSMDTAPRGIRYAVDHGARIINMSFGIELPGEIPGLREAIDYADRKGVLMFASSGNAGDKDNVITAPASMAGVVAVGAVDKSLTVTKWSNHGSELALAAPGDDIPMRCANGEGYCSSGGTSQATALASASAALVWSAHPGWTGNQVLRALIETAGRPTEGKVPSEYVGYGFVRPRMVLLEHQGDPGAANVYPLPNGPASASSSPAPSKAGQAVSSAPQHGEAEAAAGSGNTTLWVLLGLGAAVVVGGVAAFVVRRRSA
ncbi:S8 family serine peptidase [Streptomyces silvisoli]|uniref:S8 family serine peptidase n=1 Tax=Streptomyces silvisoli TaxID=3034235 RepID=A0ABT5ZW75_9ACTN|nr:S8 family serine peptidase [Streptomyces silvisoli]MDF3294076.1 S8 family serine peptidase [Streptomyces silvisoli]